MKKEHWQTLLRCAAIEKPQEVPVALIVDSPWIPGYVGMDTVDYYADLNAWWQAQQKIREDFPEIIFLPDYWVEYGMIAEPSGFGCKVVFHGAQPASAEHLISSYEDIGLLSSLKVPNPQRDGLMPLVLSHYKRAGNMAREIGEDIKIVASRGPLNIATFIMGITEFLMAYKLYPDEVHSLLKKTTQLAKDWLEAQALAAGGIEGICLLDDIIGFMSPQDYMEFAHPYFQEIYSAFPVPVRILHNDTDNPASYPSLADMGVNIFNFTFEKQLSQVRELTGESVCLMGNIPPLHTLTKGTPQEVEAECIARLEDYGSMQGIILSAGGGASPGMPAENAHAMVRAAKKWSAARTGK